MFDDLILDSYFADGNKFIVYTSFNHYFVEYWFYIDKLEFEIHHGLFMSYKYSLSKLDLPFDYYSDISQSVGLMIDEAHLNGLYEKFKSDFDKWKFFKLNILDKALMS